MCNKFSCLEAGVKTRNQSTFYFYDFLNINLSLTDCIFKISEGILRISRMNNATKLSSKLIIIPGNGCSDIRNANWYQWLADTLKSDYKHTANNLEIICETMPDPYTARAKYWIPFIKSKLDSAEKVYVVGHSSGAVAILRLCEELGQDIDAAFVVSACATHLGDDNEKASGKNL